MKGIFMEHWKKNLAICCFACFIVSIGMSQMAPILPLYIAEIGITGQADIARWSGIIFGANFISLAIASPGCLTPKNPKSLTGLIFLRKFMFFVLRNSVIYSIIEV